MTGMYVRYVDREPYLHGICVCVYWDFLVHMYEFDIHIQSRVCVP
jgi:hypothetical protein